MAAMAISSLSFSRGVRFIGVPRHHSRLPDRAAAARHGTGREARPRPRAACSAARRQSAATSMPFHALAPQSAPARSSAARSRVEPALRIGRDMQQRSRRRARRHPAPAVEHGADRPVQPQRPRRTPACRRAGCASGRRASRLRHFAHRETPEARCSRPASAWRSSCMSTSKRRDESRAVEQDGFLRQPCRAARRRRASAMTDRDTRAACAR